MQRRSFGALTGHLLRQFASTNNSINPKITSSSPSSSLKLQSILPEFENLFSSPEFLNSSMLYSKVPILSQINSYYFPSFQRSTANQENLLSKNSGKHLRSKLILLLAKTFSHCHLIEKGNTTENSILLPQSVLKLSQIVEVIHNASLLHDDVVDESRTRRGQPSAPETFGNKLSILAGDFLLANASKELALLENLKVVQIISQVISDLVEGELLQLQPPSEDAPFHVQLNHYIEKSFKKTASLIAGGCESAVLLLKQEYHKESAYNDLAVAAYEFGRNLGIAFQIIDDKLDFVGSDTGKPLGTDLRNGIVSAPILLARNEIKDLNSSFSKYSHEQTMEIILHKSKALQKTQELAIEYSEKAREYLNLFPECPTQRLLHEIIDELLMRNK